MDLDQMKRNIRNNANELCKIVNTTDVLRLMGDKLEEVDAEEIRALKERKGNSVAMDKLIEFVPRRRGAMRRFLEVLRHEDFNGDYDYLADRIEGRSSPGSGSNRPPNWQPAPPGSGSNRQPNRQPASLAFPHQVSTSDQFHLDDVDENKMDEGERVPGQFGTQSYQVLAGGEPYTVARGQAANIQSTVRLNQGSQVPPSVFSTSSSVDLDYLQTQGRIPSRPEEPSESPCAYCNGHESCSFYEKHKN